MPAVFHGSEDVLLDAAPVDSCCSEDLRIHFTQPASPPTAVGRDALPFSPHGIQVRRRPMLLVDRAAQGGDTNFGKDWHLRPVRDLLCWG